MAAIKNAFSDVMGKLGLHVAYPTTNGGMQNRGSVGACYTLRTRFRTFCVDLYAQSVLVDKISASELSRKFIKSAVLVGYYRKYKRKCHSSTRRSESVS